MEACPVIHELMKTSELEMKARFQKAFSFPSKPSKKLSGTKMRFQSQSVLPLRIFSVHVRRHQTSFCTNSSMVELHRDHVPATVSWKQHLFQCCSEPGKGAVYLIIYLTPILTIIFFLNSIVLVRGCWHFLTPQRKAGLYFRL